MDICSVMPRLPIPDASQDTGHVAGRGMRPTPAVHKPTAIPVGFPLQLGPAGAMPPGPLRMALGLRRGRRHGQRMHERAPKAAVDAYARRGHRHRRA